MDNKVKVCSDINHKYRGSKYDRDKVPIKLFMRVPDNPKSDLLKICLDCRKNVNRLVNASRERKKQRTVPTKHFMCTLCLKIKHISNVGINMDGSVSVHCKMCKFKKRNKYRKLTEAIKKIKTEMTLQINSSCQKCGKIFLQPQPKTSHAIEIIPKNGYVNYNNIQYKVESFLEKYKHILEFRIIELDHLTENEQRERELLQPNDIFIPKKKCVSDMMSEKSMRLEAKKCRILCGKCHVEETIRREKNKNPKYTGMRRKKQKYANTLKKNPCSSCGISYPNLLRFMEFDHLDCFEKIANISNMVQRKKYTIEDVVAECNKCRVLCRHCHKIHSSKQIQNLKT